MPHRVDSRDRMLVLGVITKPNTIDRDNPNPVAFVNLIGAGPCLDVREWHFDPRSFRGQIDSGSNASRCAAAKLLLVAWVSGIAAQPAVGSVARLPVPAACPLVANWAARAMDVSPLLEFLSCFP
jgi:hypothetical protein